MSRFSDQQKQALSDFITHLLAMFELRDWRVTLMDDEPDSKGAAASIKTIYGRRLANLRLMHEFFAEPIEKIGHYLVHEICHLFSEGIDCVVLNGPETLMGKPAFTIFEENYRVQYELMTDQLAYVMVDLLDGPNYRRLLWALKPLPAPTGEPVLLPAP